MSTGQNYSGKGETANPIEQTDSTIPPAANNATLTANHPDFTDTQSIPATNATPSLQRVKGDLAAMLEVSVNARYSNSASDVLIFALTEYRDSRLKQAAQEMAAGEWDIAIESLSDMDTASDLITRLALNLSQLADKNYWAIQGETPEGNGDPHSHFRTSAKHYFNWSDERINEYAQDNL